MKEYTLNLKTFILIDDNFPHSPDFNMEFDEWLLNYSLKNEIYPVMRLYFWDRVSISIGKFQNIEKELDTKKIEELKIPIVRRPTGGRAIIHIPDDLTISFIIPNYVLQPFNFRNTFMFVAENFCNIFKKIGIETFINLTPQKYEKSTLCFSSTSQYEIIDKYKNKLLGIAQLFKQDSALLQIYIPLKKIPKFYLKIFKNVNNFSIDNSLIKMKLTSSQLKEAILNNFQEIEFTHFLIKKYI